MNLDANTSRIIGDMFGVPPDAITRETTAADVPGWDSLSHTVLIMRMEQEFGKRIDPLQALHAHNVGELNDLFSP